MKKHPIHQAPDLYSIIQGAVVLAIAACAVILISFYNDNPVSALAGCWMLAADFSIVMVIGSIG